MPLPVLAGLPFLTYAVSGFFGSLLAFFARHLTQRFALALAGIGTIVFFTVAFYSAIRELIYGLEMILPQHIQNSIMLVVPDNTQICISANLSASALRLAYVWNVEFVRIKIGH
jgi:uncharacterized membrane protein YjjP (DUF1212 family)